MANHRSLREEQQLLLAPVYDADRPEGTERPAVPVVAVFGANAAGKSNVVDALRYMARMVRSSHREAEPGEKIERFPFVLDEEAVHEPSWYVVDLLLGGTRYAYGFSVEDERVLDEWLYSYPHGRKRVVFQRNDQDFTFGDTSPRKELDLVRKITAPNVLFLTIAARSQQEAVLPVYEWFLRALAFESGDFRTRRLILRRIGRMLEHSEQVPAIVGLLRAADLGIVGVGAEWEEGTGESPRQRDFAIPRVWVEQQARRGTVRLSYDDQSAGTKALLAYSGPVLNALRDGGLLVVDEIDSSLHPRLTAHLIRLFQHPATNPRGAQLLLTTHDVSLLGRSGGEDILKRDQVWFVEKDEYGETALFPLSDFKPRLEESRERRYLGGSYGAVPVLSEELFAAAVALREGTGGEDPEE
ncbi:ATP/GTP-binding protein [Streptomyces sp. NPDC050548]|uniref:ATP/GTP-binding protein n=1 Tax=Streptomyces sp. NPDC050548 TaxID=3365629 RepID=UPI003797C4F4